MPATSRIHPDLDWLASHREAPRHHQRGRNRRHIEMTCLTHVPSPHQNFLLETNTEKVLRYRSDRLRQFVSNTVVLKEVPLLTMLRALLLQLTDTSLTDDFFAILASTQACAASPDP